MTESLFKYKLTDIHILSAACIHTSASIYVIQLDLIQLQYVKYIMLGDVISMFSVKWKLNVEVLFTETSDFKDLIYLAHHTYLSEEKCKFNLNMPKNTWPSVRQLNIQNTYLFQSIMQVTCHNTVV